MKRKFIFFTVITAISVCVIGGVTMIVNSQEDKATRTRRQIEQNGDPVADFNEQGPNDEKGRRLHNARKNKFNSGDAGFNGSDKRRFAVNENSPSVKFAMPSLNLKEQPSFPLAKSTHVLVGTVTNARAYLAEDRIFAYSELGFNVEGVLKDYGNIFSGTPVDITLTRAGGKVRLPSGRILHHGVVGSPIPKIGNKYLMFLTYEPQAESFNINVVYEIRNGVVFAFDGKDQDGNYMRRFRSYQRYDGMNEMAFVEVVRNALANQVGGVR